MASEDRARRGTPLDATPDDRTRAGKKPAGPSQDDHDSVALLHTTADRVHEVEQTIGERWDAVADPIRGRLQKPVARVTGWARWVQGLRPYRVYNQYAYADGNLRAAGMSFQALFAIFAGVWLGFSLIGVWLGGDEQLVDHLTTFIDSIIPGLIGTDGLISKQALTELSGFGWTGLIATVGLLWTAIAWLYYTRQAVRAMFGLERDSRNYVLQKVTDLGLAVAFGVVLLISALLSVASTEALTLIFGLFGIPDDSFWFTSAVRVTGLVLVVALNMVTLGVMYRVLSQVAIPWRRLLLGTLLGAIALGGLSALSGVIFAGASRNPLFASFTVVVGLLLYLNIVSRVMLLGASWIAVGMKDNGISPRHLTAEQRERERAADELRARIVVARSDVDNAQEALEHAGWMRRITARRTLGRAQDRLSALEAEQHTSAPGNRGGFDV